MVGHFLFPLSPINNSCTVRVSRKVIPGPRKLLPYPLFTCPFMDLLFVGEGHVKEVQEHRMPFKYLLSVKEL